MSQYTVKNNWLKPWFVTQNLWSVKGQQYKIEMMTRPGHIHFSLFDTSYNSTAFFEYFQLPPQSQCAALWKEEFGWKTALKIAALYEEGKEHDKVSRIFSPIWSIKRPPRQLRLPWHAEIPLEWPFNHLHPVQCNLTNFYYLSYCWWPKECSLTGNITLSRVRGDSQMVGVLPSWVTLNTLCIVIWQIFTCEEWLLIHHLISFYCTIFMRIGQLEVPCGVTFK